MFFVHSRYVVILEVFLLIEKMFYMLVSYVFRCVFFSNAEKLIII